MLVQLGLSLLETGGLGEAELRGRRCRRCKGGVGVTGSVAAGEVRKTRDDCKLGNGAAEVTGSLEGRGGRGSLIVTVGGVLCAVASKRCCKICICRACSAVIVLNT